MLQEYKTLQKYMYDLLMLRYEDALCIKLNMLKPKKTIFVYIFSIIKILGIHQYAPLEPIECEISFHISDTETA